MLTLLIIISDLCSQVGRGNQIFVGIDPIGAYGRTSLSLSLSLSHNLICHLRARSNFALNHIYYEEEAFRPHSISSWDLNLHGELALEWYEYVNCMILEGITLSDASDHFFLCLNKQSGNVTAKLAYSSLVHKKSSRVDCWWTSRLWNGNFPLKIKCFGWLCFHHKILTWDAL